MTLVISIEYVKFDVKNQKIVVKLSIKLNY